MRKPFLLIPLLCLVLQPFSALADDDYLAEPEEISDLTAPGESDSTGLVDMEDSKTRIRVRDLERRVRDLEVNQKFTEERIRSLDRSINDLKRKR